MLQAAKLIWQTDTVARPAVAQPEPRPQRNGLVLSSSFQTSSSPSCRPSSFFHLADLSATYFSFRNLIGGGLDFHHCGDSYAAAHCAQPARPLHDAVVAAGRCACSP